MKGDKPSKGMPVTRMVVSMSLGHMAIMFILCLLIVLLCKWLEDSKPKSSPPPQPAKTAQAPLRVTDQRRRARASTRVAGGLILDRRSEEVPMREISEEEYSGLSWMAPSY